MDKEELNGYSLSRDWFDFCFENPENISTNHTALYFFIIEHCNRLGWKAKFGLPMEMAKDAIGIKNYRTYSKTFNDLVDWGFIEVIQRSKNQYSANIIAIVKNTKAKSKALDKAMQKHSQKQVHGIVGINKPINNKPRTYKPRTVTEQSSDTFLFNEFKRIFLDRYKQFNGQEYYFQAIDGKKITSLIKKIDYAYKSKNRIPTDADIINGFVHVLKKAHADKWLSDHFSLANIDSQFNNLIIKKNGSSESVEDMVTNLIANLHK